ncbi:MAG: NUDIX hydrolase, partial [Traorella sp.]
MEKLYQQIQNYQPFNEQEKIDKEKILQALSYENILLRDNNFMHLSASCWICNQTFDKVLMIYHNIYQSWSWLGGHADGEADLLAVSKKELEEESGLKKYKLLDENPFSLEILTVNGHIKNKQYVNSHLHLNVTYLFESNEKDLLVQNEEETSGIQWIRIEDLKEKVSEE